MSCSKHDAQTAEIFKKYSIQFDLQGQQFVCAHHFIEDTVTQLCCISALLVAHNCSQCLLLANCNQTQVDITATVSSLLTWSYLPFYYYILEIYIYCILCEVVAHIIYPILCKRRQRNCSHHLMHHI